MQVAYADTCAHLLLASELTCQRLHRRLSRQNLNILKEQYDQTAVWWLLMVKNLCPAKQHYIVQLTRTTSHKSATFVSQHKVSQACNSLYPFDGDTSHYQFEALWTLLIECLYEFTWVLDIHGALALDAFDTRFCQYIHSHSYYSRCGLVRTPS